MKMSPLKISVLFCLLIVALILSSLPVMGESEGDLSESGETFAEVGPGSPIRYPLILTEHRDQKTVRFWASPYNISSVPQTVYDQWTFVVHGNIGDVVKINFSRSELFNFSLDRNIEFIQFDASRFGNVQGFIEINGTRFIFKYLNVQHQELSVAPSGSGGSGKKYDDWDMMVGNLKSGAGVACSGVLVVPVFVILAYLVKNMRGVKKW